MKKILVILVILSIFLVSCSKEKVENNNVDSSQDDISNDDTSTLDNSEEIIVDETEDDYAFDVAKDETEFKEVDIEEKYLTQIQDDVCNGKKFKFLPVKNPGTLKIGESYVYGIGVGNYMGDTKNFKLKVVVDKAKDKYSNTLVDADLDYIKENWLADAELGPKLLGDDQCYVFKFKVTVGDKMSKSANTQPGTYNFNVDILYMQDNREYQYNTGTFVIATQVE